MHSVFSVVRYPANHRGHREHRGTPVRIDGEMAALQLAQEIHHLRLLPVDGADELAAHNAVAVDDVSLGEFLGAVEQVCLLLVVAHSQKADIVVPQKSLVLSWVVVYAHG